MNVIISKTFTVPCRTDPVLLPSANGTEVITSDTLLLALPELSRESGRLDQLMALFGGESCKGTIALENFSVVCNEHPDLIKNLMDNGFLDVDSTQTESGTGRLRASSFVSAAETVFSSSPTRPVAFGSSVGREVQASESTGSNCLMNEQADIQAETIAKLEVALKEAWASEATAKEALDAECERHDADVTELEAKLTAHEAAAREAKVEIKMLRTAVDDAVSLRVEADRLESEARQAKITIKELQSSARSHDVKDDYGVRAELELRIDDLDDALSCKSEAMEHMRQKKDSELAVMASELRAANHTIGLLTTKMAENEAELESMGELHSRNVELVDALDEQQQVNKDLRQQLERERVGGAVGAVAELLFPAADEKSTARLVETGRDDGVNSEIIALELGREYDTKLNALKVAHRKKILELKAKMSSGEVRVAGLQAELAASSKREAGAVAQVEALVGTLNFLSCLFFLIYSFIF